MAISCVMFVLAGIWRDAPPWQLLVLGAFGTALGVVVATDLRDRRIPNAVTYPGTLGALGVASLGGWTVLGLAIAGGVVAAGALWILSRVLRGALGLGDVKLSAFIGSALGLGGVPLFLVSGSSVGAVAALALLLYGRDRHSTFAYGPALVVGAWIAVLVRGLSIS